MLSALILCKFVNDIGQTYTINIKFAARYLKMI